MFAAIIDAYSHDQKQEGWFLESLAATRENRTGSGHSAEMQYSSEILLPSLDFMFARTSS